jgi:hypothetical protein
MTDKEILGFANDLMAMIAQTAMDQHTHLCSLETEPESWEIASALTLDVIRPLDMAGATLSLLIGAFVNTDRKYGEKRWRRVAAKAIVENAASFPKMYEAFGELSPEGKELKNTVILNIGILVGMLRE